MSREVDIELVRFRGLRQYNPKVGDFIICHGFFVRTKWFGIINYIDRDGKLHIAVGGLPKLLFSMTPAEIGKNINIVDPVNIQKASAGSYSIMQQELTTNIPVWYV